MVKHYWSWDWMNFYGSLGGSLVLVLISSFVVLAAIAADRFLRRGEDRGYDKGDEGIGWLNDGIRDMEERLGKKGGLPWKILAAWGNTRLGSELKKGRRKAIEEFARCTIDKPLCFDFWNWAELLGRGRMAPAEMIDLTLYISHARLFDLELAHMAAKTSNDENPDYQTFAGVGPTAVLLPQEQSARGKYMADPLPQPPPIPEPGPGRFSAPTQAASLA